MSSTCVTCAEVRVIAWQALTMVMIILVTCFVHCYPPYVYGLRCPTWRGFYYFFLSLSSFSFFFFSVGFFQEVPVRMMTNEVTLQPRAAFTSHIKKSGTLLILKNILLKPLCKAPGKKCHSTRQFSTRKQKKTIDYSSIRGHVRFQAST